MGTIVLTPVGTKKVRSQLGGRTLSYFILSAIYNSGEMTVDDLMKQTSQLPPEKVKRALAILHKKGYIKADNSESVPLSEIG